MPVVWGPHNNSDIFFMVAIFDAATVAVQAPFLAAVPTPLMFKALIDTGAQKQ